MLSKDTYDGLIRNGGCVHETNGAPCAKVVQPGKKHCARHELEAETKAARPVKTARRRIS